MANKSSDKTINDALFILDALQHVTSTVMINAGEIAAKKSAKVNTIQKRFTTLKQRYPNLNIQTTSVGASVTATAAPARAHAPRVTKPAKAAKPSGKNGKASKAKQAAVQAKVEEEDEEEEEEEGDEGQMEEIANNQLEEDMVKQEDAEEDADSM